MKNCDDSIFNNLEKNISVVVQGPILPFQTAICLKSIRKFLPKAEIILSTWEGSNINDLDYDVLVLNKDPGAEIFTVTGQLQNQNRQIVSAKEGIKKASRLYVLKIRSDMELKGTKFLSFWKKYPMRSEECKVLSERILINSLYTRRPISTKPFLFHPSDWVMFGLKKDVLNVWDIPLAPEPQTSQYFKVHKNMKYDGNCLTQYHAEQYIWLSFLRKNGFQINYENYMIFSKELMDFSRLSIVNNTVLLEYITEFDIVSQKHPEQMGDSETMHPIDWMIDYKKFCDPTFYISWDSVKKGILQTSGTSLRLRKHIHKFFERCKRLNPQCIEDCVAVIYCFFKLQFNCLYAYLKYNKTIF